MDSEDKAWAIGAVAFVCLLLGLAAIDAYETSKQTDLAKECVKAQMAWDGAFKKCSPRK